jgi:hypothetical protein
MNRFWKAVLLTTLVAGTLDIIAAHLHFTINTGEWPRKMFYAIAGGAIGLKTALAGGPAVVVLGVFIHYFISFSFTLFFFLLYPVISKISVNKYLNGVVYTIFVWLIMNFIVLPLTALPSKPFVLDINKVIGFLILTIVFGIPISIMADKYYRTRTHAGDNLGGQAGLVQG